MSKKRKSLSAHKRFVGIPHRIVDSKSYALLSGSAAKLLVMIAKQYNGRNNGNLTCTWKDMKNHFGGQDTMRKALKALIDKRLIEVTGTGTSQRRGGNPPVLYALIWEAIDEYYGGGTMTSTPTRTPIRNDWDPI